MRDSIVCSLVAGIMERGRKIDGRHCCKDCVNLFNVYDRGSGLTVPRQLIFIMTFHVMGIKKCFWEIKQDKIEGLTHLLRRTWLGLAYASERDA